MDKLWSTRQGNLYSRNYSLPHPPVITIISLTTPPCHLSPVFNQAVNQNSAAFDSNHHISQFWRLHLYGAVSRRTSGQKLETLNWSLSPIINTHFSHSCPSRIPFCYLVLLSPSDQSSGNFYRRTTSWCRRILNSWTFFTRPWICSN